MRNHTPGPWFAVGPFVSTQNNKIDIKSAIVSAVGDKSEDEQEANAELMAAAPDLLEALKSVTDAAENCTGNEPSISVLHRAIDEARAAIAKAEQL